MTDRLNIPSRNFFERTKLKLSASISIAGIGVMLLGFCAFSCLYSIEQAYAQMGKVLAEED